MVTKHFAILLQTYDAVDLATLQRPQECAELPHQKLGDPDVADSAATKIQAGVRGFIARRQVQRMRTDQPPNTKGDYRGPISN